MTKFDKNLTTFDEVLTGNLEKSRKSGKKWLKVVKSVFLALRSVKHFKKYEKGGFLELCLDL